MFSSALLGAWLTAPLAATAAEPSQATTGAAGASGAQDPEEVSEGDTTDPQSSTEPQSSTDLQPSPSPRPVTEPQPAPEARGTSDTQTATSVNAPSFDLSVAVSHVMKNELEIVMQPIPGAPVVSVCTSIDAGSRRDPVSAPGAYRALAEMLKDGGYRSTAQDYGALVTSRGGVSEVEVTRDATTFCTTVPAGELPLALWVSAGRFTGGALKEESLRAAIDVLAKDSDALDAEVRQGRVPERLRKMAFLGSYEDSHPTLPSSDDLDALTLKTIRQLHQESYVARRAKIAISGGFTQAEAEAEFPAHLFAARPGTKRELTRSALVPQHSGRFSMAEDSSATTPAAWYGWVSPPGEDRRSLEIALAALVSDARLSGKLVGQTRAAKSVELYLDDDASPKEPALARLEIVGSNSQSLGVIEKGFDAELNSLLQRGLTEEELAQVQKGLRSKQRERLLTTEDRARALSRGVLLGRSPSEVLAPLNDNAEYAKLSPEGVRLAAARLLDPLKRSAIEIYPKGWQDPWQKPMQRWHIVQKGQTLGSIANAYATSVAVITKMNGMSAKNPIYPGDKLRVPRGNSKPEKPGRSHKVVRGDTVSGLAVKYGVSSSAIAEANGMGTKLIIRSGETLVIPWASKSEDTSSSKSGGQVESETKTNQHVVKPGETLSGIAQANGVSAVALARANGISQKTMVKVGQSLNLPPRGTGKESGSASAPQVLYTVKKGDTLSGIASRHGVSVKALTVENSIGRASTLRLGQTLRIPPKE